MLKTLVATALTAVSFAAFAQGAFPNKPVRFIVPFPPGQATDIMARLLGDTLSRQWGQQVLIENRGGGASIPGMVLGRDAAPDGHTLTLGSSGSMGVNPTLYPNLPYDPLKDFALVNGVFIVPLMIIAHPAAPYANIREMIAAARKEPGKLAWAYAGTGTSQHLTGELFKSRTGVDILGVTYKGSGPAITDLMGGQVPLMVDSLASALPHIKAGKVKALAMTTLQRVPQLPDLPTVAESGYPGFDGNGWAGLIAPRATPREIVEKISADVRRALTDPAMQQRIIERGAIPDPRGPKEWGDFIAAEIVKWGEIVRKANLKPE
ncbi:MAG: tripartite tricarboxylate transporter substrate binding protein [Burkholderiales bacterium]|nr:tripartite tricarboxylate transporter substrate binding protein [Burkholderiales bacterium]